MALGLLKMSQNSTDLRIFIFLPLGAQNCRGQPSTWKQRFTTRSASGIISFLQMQQFEIEKA